MSNDPKLPEGFSYQSMSLADLVDRRNFVAILLGKSGIPQDGLTVSGLGLLFIEACKGNKHLIEQNMTLLIEAYEEIEAHAQTTYVDLSDNKKQTVH